MAQSVFMDRSALDGSVGTATVLIRPDKSTHMLHFFLVGLDSDSKHTIHEAELVGILLGIHPIKTEKQDWKADVATVQQVHMPK